MAVVLGIDAAWTVEQPSGVALLDTEQPVSNCLAVAPSYKSFLEFADRGEVRWHDRQQGEEAPVAELLAASERIAGRAVDVVAIDMPVAREPITGRREADRAISREFGSRGASAHTPNASRPGALGARITESFAAWGYPVATAGTRPATSRRLVEVYPHTALLALLNRQYRVPYKVAKACKYWPDIPSGLRLRRIVEELRAVEVGLARELGLLPFSIPSADETQRPAKLKRYEDALDALISAWVGSLYMQGLAVPLGDTDAAIWCPIAAIRPPKDAV